MKTIFNTYVKVKSQAQANFFNQICINNDLPIWEDEKAFVYLHPLNVFGCDNNNGGFGEFFIFSGVGGDLFGKTEVTESEWLELLKQHQCTK